MNLIAQVNESKRCGGDLRKSKLVVKLVEFVNCQPDFYDIPKVIWTTLCYRSQLYYRHCVIGDLNDTVIVLSIALNHEFCDEIDRSARYGGWFEGARAIWRLSWQEFREYNPSLCVNKAQNIWISSFQDHLCIPFEGLSYQLSLTFPGNYHCTNIYIDDTSAEPLQQLAQTYCNYQHLTVGDFC